MNGIRDTKRYKIHLTGKRPMARLTAMDVPREKKAQHRSLSDSRW
jgi:hypothetical protein